MITNKIDKTLQDLIVNLKLTRPNSIYAFQKESKQNTQKNNHQKQLTKERINEDSLVNDNFDDLNCYSFLQLKQTQVSKKRVQLEQFSFCHQFSTENDDSLNHEDSLSRFSSIVDKLKTEGDHLQNQNFFYSTQTYEQEKTQRLAFNNQFHCKQIQNTRQRERRHTQYFSQSILKSNQKSYRQLAVKKLQHNFSKPKLGPIYAKLNLHNDKQNNQQNSNVHPKNTLISVVSSNNIKYSSNKKKPFTAGNNNTKIFESFTNKQKVKGLNQKIRKQNHIVYQSQFKQKILDVSPLITFKKANIQPHKFSSYKVKLFG